MGFSLPRSPKKFRDVYAKIFPIIKDLEHERLEHADFDDRELRDKIEEIFDKVANCSWKYESTDASKILHTILPNLFVMWDRKIRRGILGSEERNWGAVFAIEFLPKMKEELIEAIKKCKQMKKFSNKEAAQHISQLCDNKTLPKLIDEYNYMSYTRPSDFREYIRKLVEKVRLYEAELVFFGKMLSIKRKFILRDILIFTTVMRKSLNQNNSEFDGHLFQRMKLILGKMNS